MQIRYCDQCSLRISQADMDAGMKEQPDGRLLCVKCAPPVRKSSLAIKPVVPAPAAVTSTATRHSKKESQKAQPAQGFNTGLIAGGIIGGIVILLGVVLLA